MATAIIPLKDLVQAKTRLAGVLRPSERRALAQAMAEDVLDTLARHRLIENIVLVSDDPGAALLGKRYQAECWSERSLTCTGLNAVLAAASARVQSLFAGQQLILHADIPLISPQDIDRVVAAIPGSEGFVIGPDRHRIGTNLLAFDVGCEPQFQFGMDSFALHLASAEANHLSAIEICSTGVGLDVDEPMDLALLMSNLDAGHAAKTQQMLNDTGVKSRLQLTLATLSSGGTPLAQETNI